MLFGMQGPGGILWVWYSWYARFSKYIIHVLIVILTDKIFYSFKAIVKLLEAKPKATLKDAMYIARQALALLQQCLDTTFIIHFRDNVKRAQVMGCNPQVRL